MRGIRLAAVPDRHASHRLLERHVEEDRQVPPAGELVAVQEHALHDHDAAGRHRHRFGDDRGVRAMVEDRRRDPALGERVEDVGDERREVIGVQEEAFGGVAPQSVAHPSRVEEVVLVHHHDRPVFVGRGEARGEGRLAAAVDPVDRDQRGPVRRHGRARHDRREHAYVVHPGRTSPAS
jgi:hypothetical protein